VRPASLRVQQAEADRILREVEVGHRTGLSRTTRWRLAKAGKFPSPVRLTERAIGWRESAILAWIAACRAKPEPR